MGAIDDTFRVAIDKLSNSVEEIVDFVEEVFKQFTNWLVEEYYKEKQKKKERFFPSDQLAFLVMCTQNTKKPCGNKPLMFWSGFV